MGERRVDPPGTAPWDRWHGARIGGIVGGILGIVVAQFFEPPQLWVALVAAVGGAVIGYWTERRKQH